MCKVFIQLKKNCRGWQTQNHWYFVEIDPQKYRTTVCNFQLSIFNTVGLLRRMNLYLWTYGWIDRQTAIAIPVGLSALRCGRYKEENFTIQHFLFSHNFSQLFKYNSHNLGCTECFFFISFNLDKSKL